MYTWVLASTNTTQGFYCRITHTQVSMKMEFQVHWQPSKCAFLGVLISPWPLPARTCVLLRRAAAI